MTIRDAIRQGTAQLVAAAVPEARLDAETALLRLVEEGEKEQAAEGAALGAGFVPCLCVVEGRQVTLAVGKQTLTQGEAALLHTIAQTHTGAAPGQIMLLTGSDTIREVILFPTMKPLAEG